MQFMLEDFDENKSLEDLQKTIRYNMIDKMQILINASGLQK